MDRFILIGRVCGYPECCIKTFCEEFGTRKDYRKLTGTGYVPCPECNKLSVQTLLEQIASRRDPRLRPFPDQTGLREVYMNMPEWIAILEQEAQP